MDVMTPEVVCCFAEDELEDAARRMEEERLGRLVVLDADRRPVGVLALSDVARHARDAAR
jgi:IMP dehydrogenase